MRISREHVDIMICHARAEAPNEACGLLAGMADTATSVHCLENAQHSPSEYALAAEGYRLLMDLDDAGQLLGAFHSHVHGPAYPSPTDRRMAAWPIHNVIVSLEDSAHPVVRAFRIVKHAWDDAGELGEVIEEQIEVV